jgi:nitrite reductase (NO-forming)
VSSIEGGPDRPGLPITPTSARPGPRAHHLRAHVLVVGWLALALVAASVRQSLPVARWLAVHLLLLGAATTAIVIWSEHFTVALLHARRPDERWSQARLAGVNLGVAGVLTGVWQELPALTAAGCLLLVAAVTAHLVVLVRLGRGSLGGRLKQVTAYYRLAAAALITGAVLGWLLADGTVASPGLHTGLRLAHLHVTLLGWIGLPVLGTLFMLWPTVLGVRMRDATAQVARWVLWLTGCGLLVAVAALSAGWRWPAAAGVAVYAAGVAVAVRLFARTVHRRPAVSAAAASMLAAAAGWLLVGVTSDLVLLATRPLPEVSAGLEPLVPVFLLGFTGQVLVGALTYLLPVVLSRGPRERSAVRDVLERAWVPRVAALNLGVALLVLPPRPPGVFGTAGTVLAAAAGIAFLVLLVTVLGRGFRHGFRRAAVTTSRRPVLLGAASGAVLTVLAVLLAGGGGSGGPVDGGPASDAGASAVPAAGNRTVRVSLMDLRISPDRIEVPAGTALRLEVTNRDAVRHDLRVTGGAATPLLAKGRGHTLDLGRITEDLEAWCGVPGHRAAGMSLDIVVREAAAGPTAEAAGGHQHAGTGMDAGGGGLPLADDFSAGRRPYPAQLRPAAPAKLHRIELHAAHSQAEVAPGVRQLMWTFGGTAPGPTLHGSVGDLFEVTLVNDDQGMGHGIDFHAGALAPDGPMRTLEPGGRLVYRFRAERAGAWLYHCSTSPMLQHLGNGMYGAVIIDPPGLPAVDHSYALVASELYLGTPGSAAQVAKMRQDTPDAWVFNGAAAQYAKAPLTVRAGERARFWVIAAGPSDGIAFHIVGTVFDTVYKEGAYLLTPGQPGGSQVLDLAPAQGGFVETVFTQPGHYSFVDHDMRHAESGARGVIEVS